MPKQTKNEPIKMGYPGMSVMSEKARKKYVSGAAKSLSSLVSNLFIYRPLFKVHHNFLDIIAPAVFTAAAEKRLLVL